MERAIEMKNISKSFGKNSVLKNIDLEINRGSIHALLGENGTGKSTLMNILNGLLKPDQGTIKIFNKQYSYKNLKWKSQISFVHQELSLVNDLSVYENLFLGNEILKGGLLDKKKMIKEAQSILDQMDLKIDCKEKVANLEISSKQLVEISKSLIHKAEIIILDEPTSSLNDVEISTLFRVMKKLKEHGKTLIFISHKLNEVLQICDSFTVMRDGRAIKSGPVTEETTESQLSGYMVGKKLSMFSKELHSHSDEKTLEIKHMSKTGQFKDINMTAFRGEIVGFTGLDGDGKSELFESVTGSNYPYSGEILVNGKPINARNTSNAFLSGLTYVSRNRKENGIFKDLSVEDNLLMPIYSKLSKYGLINTRAKQIEFNEMVQDLHIKFGDENDRITSLSGGNQQKILIARALSSIPKIVILDNPTQGVDINSKFEIYSYIQKLSNLGVTFVILTNEYNEIKKLCDQIYIMYQGEIQKKLTYEELTEEKVLFYSMGGRNQDEGYEENKVL
ncbi:sugar ABC transporter ATP-binding protein [Companilactobacillus huachuanensis]|uniref:Sugar ABC transporter ATP-binding protein n=1 Tax=Companilactobacillus huachuanensis TaxID=2559914 RepID=A0ABW1RQK3_9LACO|nr:sugar ABC transporter ATP-binding protein [Companilactobacillus huachuanensis]